MAAWPAHGQPVFDWLTRADGLPSDYVLAVYPDRWGFLWFGTDAGAVRWDGRMARTFSVDDGLPHAYVRSFAETTDSTLWVSTNAGIAQRTPGGWTSVETPTGHPLQGPLLNDERGRLIVLGTSSLARREGSLWRTASWPAGYSSGPVSVAEVGDGRLILSRIDPALEVFLLTPEGDGRFRAEPLALEGRWPPRETVRRLQVHRVGTRLIGVTGGETRHLISLQFDGRRLLATGTRPLDANGTVVTDGEQLYHYAEEGLWRVDLETGASTLLYEGHVTHATFDHEGGLWMGTFGNGVARLHSTHLTTLSTSPALRIALSGNTAWATGDRHLVRVDLASGEIRASQQRIAGVRVLTLREDGRLRLTNRAWLLPSLSPEASGGIPKDLRVVGAEATDSGWISGVVETADSLWLGSYSNGIRRFRSSARGLVELDTLGVPDGLPTETVEDVVRTSAGTWAITRSGLALLRGDRFHTVGVDHGLPSSSVYSLYEARDGTHWVGTDRGVARLSLEFWRAEAIGTREMEGRAVVALFERPQAPEAVWAVTTQGLWRIQNGHAVRQGFPLVRDARQTVESAAYHAPSDRLVLATSAGVSVADLAALPTAPPEAPPVAIVRTLVNDEPVMLTGTPRDAQMPPLPPGRHRIEIDVAALRYAGSARVEWRDDDGLWREAMDGRITLQNVGAGDYAIDVRAVAPGGAVSEEEARLSFRVAPRWWERRAVQVLVALFAVAALVAGVRVVSQRPLRARVRELEVEQRLQSERERISRDLHDHVGAEVAAILTEAEIARLQAQAEGREAHAFHEVETRARRTMGSLREAIWSLGHGALTPASLAERLGAFGRTQARARGLAVEARAQGDTDRPLAPTHALALYRIGQEAVRNAVCHSGGSQLIVTVEAGEKRAAVIVRDDGSFRVASGDGGGFGLENMRARAEALSGTFSITNGDGTTVRAEIPL